MVWDMKTLEGSESYPLALKGNGPMQVEQLDAAEYTGSLKRGGSGFAAALNGQSYLALDAERARTLRPESNAVSLYTRAWVGPEGEGALFFSDFMALVIHPSGLAIGFLGVKTPHGKVYRELPLAVSYTHLTLPTIYSV